MTPYLNSRWIIRLGDFDLESSIDDGPVLEREIEDYFVHPKYDRWKAYFDLAVLRVPHIEYTSYIRPVCLPPPADPNVFV